MLPSQCQQLSCLIWSMVSATAWLRLVMSLCWALTSAVMPSGPRGEVGGGQLLSTEGIMEALDLRLRFPAPLLPGRLEEAHLTSQSLQADSSSASLM